MPLLARALQDGFSRALPEGWTALREAPVVRSEYLRTKLGYAPRVDLLLERRDGSRRLWVEFEISRADPVANHAKFATVHLFQPFDQSDTFVAMVSPHVDRGRRNLAANAVEVMRRIGIDAFQTPLLPHLSPAEVKRLNHLSDEELRGSAPDVKEELERLFAIAEPALPGDRWRIHFAADLFDVMLNIDAWNRQIASPAGAAKWGRRKVHYFAFDAVTRAFAPSKFCAFVPVTVGAVAPPHERAMSIGTYATLDESEPRFDGHRARSHLERRLGMALVPAGQALELDAAFAKWRNAAREAITVHPRGPAFLVPPAWF